MVVKTHDNNLTRSLSHRWVANARMNLHSLARAITDFLAQQIKISEILPWDRKSSLTHAILPMLSREG